MDGHRIPGYDLDALACASTRDDWPWHGVAVARGLGRPALRHSTSASPTLDSLSDPCGTVASGPPTPLWPKPWRPTAIASPPCSCTARTAGKAAWLTG